MSTIRPLATIAVLFGVGLFLWLRINDAPLVPVDDLSQSSRVDASSDAMPTLFEPSASGDSFAPPVAMTPPTKASPSTGMSTPTLPDLPDLPEWPDNGSANGEPALSTQTPRAVEVPLPQEIPTANYGNTTTGDISGNVPSLGTTTPDLSSSGVNMSADPLANADILIDPEPPSTPFGQTTIDEGMSPTVASGEFDAPSAFANAMPAIEAKLAQGELATALRELTEWYGDSSLTPQENEQVEQLLSQLAGTVVYGTSHLLEPPHQVAQGETLESIAAEYDVPWQLLAKINGVSDSISLAPGQQLKVIRGPFSGVIFIDRQKMALDVAGHYAGRFSVKAQGAAASEGDWVVEDKLVEATTGGELTKQIVLRAAGGDVTILLTSDANAGGYGSPYRGKVLVAPADENDLFDILSVGSRIIVRR